MKITYPVPAETTTVFVVVTERTPTELSSIVPWRMGRPHRRAAMEALGTPRLELDAFRAAQSPWRRMDLDGDEIRRQVRRARHHIVVSSTAPVTAQPEAAQIARAAARGVAEAYHGTIVDPLTRTVLAHCPECPGERQEFRLGDDWLGWTSEIDETDACSPGDPAGPCPCTPVKSRGLRRFGLPEIMLDGAACAHGFCAVDILHTVADRLLAGHLDWVTGHPGARSRTIGGHLRIGESDFAVFSGSPDLDDEPFRVRLTRDAADLSCLRVGSPDGYGDVVGDRSCRATGFLAA